MTIVFRLFILSMIIMLTGCGETGYHATDDTGGYYDKRINDNTYIIGFSGNGYSNFNTVRDYTFLHAAEIGKKLGYQYFTTNGVKDLSTSEKYLQSTPLQSQATQDYFGNIHVQTTGGELYTQTVSYPKSAIKATYYSEKPSENQLRIYNITSVINKVTKKYDMNLKELRTREHKKLSGEDWLAEE